MQVILKKDVKDVGRVGDMVKVKDGFARNFLFPRKLAVEATPGKVKEFKHWQRVSDSRKKAAAEERKAVIKKLEGITLQFKVTAGETEKLFGSITTKDIANELDKKGFSVDRRDIVLPEPIKMLGQHKATVKFGEGIEGEIAVSVERA